MSRSLTTAIVGGPTRSRSTLRSMDCGPCVPLRRHAAPHPNTDFSIVDLAGKSLVSGCVSDVFVPSSFAARWDASRIANHASKSNVLDLLLRGRQLVVLLERPSQIKGIDVSVWRRFCVCVPGGPLSSRMMFDTSYQDVMSEEMNVFLDAMYSESATAGEHLYDMSWIAFIRSALTCKFEGMHVPPIRVSDMTSQIILGDGGDTCERVIWEESVASVTPRWLETALKTASSCGVPLSRLGLSLCKNGDRSAELVAAALSLGIDTFVASSVDGVVLPYADARVRLDGVLACAVGGNEVAGGLTDEDMDALDSCTDLCEWATEEWQKKE